MSRLNLEMQEITASALYGEINRGMRNLKSPEIHTGPPDVQLAKAWRCALAGSARTGTAGVPAKRSSLRVRVPRWASSPRKLR